MKRKKLNRSKRKENYEFNHQNHISKIYEDMQFIFIIYSCNNTAVYASLYFILYIV
jgi:hypothetical protein